MLGHWWRGFLAAAVVAFAASAGLAAPAPLDYELLFWQAIANSAEASDYTLYLRFYPQGRFSAEARQLIETLTAVDAATPQPSATEVYQGSQDSAVSPFGEPQHWVHDPVADCWAHVADPNNEEIIVWKGDCRGHKLEGPGAVLWIMHGKIGRVSIGTFTDGVLNGPGKVLYRAGARLEGEFADTRLNGHGLYAYADGGQEEGGYKDGKLDGHAVWRRPNGFSGEADYKAGKFDGHAVLRYPNGDVVEGEYRAGAENGLIKVTRADGSATEVEYAAGVPNGQARVMLLDKSRLEGRYEAGKPAGDWTYVSPTGETLAGPYVSPRRDAEKSKPFDDLYPAISRRLGEQGTVVVRMTVNRDGRVSDVAIAQSSGSDRLDAAAVQAVKERYVFQPATIGGRPIVFPGWLIQIRWTLTN